MATSYQSLREELNALVFEIDEMDYRDESELKSLMSLLANEDFNSDVINHFMRFSNEEFSTLELSIDTLMEKRNTQNWDSVYLNIELCQNF